MTRPNTVDKPPSRAERKATLLAELEQQRIDILVNSDTLTKAASPLDNNWRNLKIPLYVIGGVAALRILRHPGGAMAVGRKALASYMLIRKLKLLARVTS
ncbi:YqjK family protein [Halomonas sp. TD01]|uniref:YqjK family protein n=1 Tax=Halomonas sp. TD01 TaxID=999141 RepID=UPI000214F1AF|nr:YqjK family protein [Halomonas sp. TD01]EGP20309.1 hypothetical protein GME_07051 [Halomonas sp. TD01]CAH1045309.1 hypothetical protein HPTD01_3787 [Halomonas sp. TD01]